MSIRWYIFRMDDGLDGPYPTLRATREALPAAVGLLNPPIIRRLGPGDYEWVSTMQDTAFTLSGWIWREDVARREGAIGGRLTRLRGAYGTAV